MRYEPRNRPRPLFAAPARPVPREPLWRRVFGIMWRALKRTCMAVGAMVLLSVVLGVFFSSFVADEVEEPALPSKMVLYLSLENGMAERRDVTGYGFADRTPVIREVTDALDRAGGDSRVKGFVLRVDGGGLNAAHAAELRAALARFRAAGKFAWIYAAGYEGLGQYALATAFDQIWLQPMGIVSIPGVQAEVPFVRPLLDRLGVEPQIFARKEYKNFFETATSSAMSSASREMTRAIVDDIGGTLIAAIAQGRGMEEPAVRALVDKGLLTGQESLDARLVDRLDDDYTMDAAIRETITGDPDSADDVFAPLSAYIRDGTKAGAFAAIGAKKPKVALLYITGEIVERGNETRLAVSDSLTLDLDDIADDDSIKALVLRVDSPGGSPVAAEAIRRAVARVKDSGKPVIVSMGEAAASGGYWVIADADRIFALPSTLTGSIGVTGGKFSLEGLWSRAGVKWDTVSLGENAGLWSFNRPYSSAEAARMNAMMDDVYAAFVSRVATGRGLAFEEAEKIARGRVWTGRQAHERGLVDALGGLDAALDYAAAQVGAPDRRGLRIEVMPRPLTPLEKVVDLIQNQVRIGLALHSRAADFLRATTRSGPSVFEPVAVR